MVQTVFDYYKMFEGSRDEASIAAGMALGTMMQNNALFAALPVLVDESGKHDIMLEVEPPEIFNLGFNSTDDVETVTTPEVKTVNTKILATGGKIFRTLVNGTEEADLRNSPHYARGVSAALAAMPTALIDMMINGDSSTDPNEFDGFKKVVSSDYTYTGPDPDGSTNGALSLETISFAGKEMAQGGNKLLIMNNRLNSKFSTVALNSSFNFVRQGTNGAQFDMFEDMMIHRTGSNGSKSSPADIIAFNEPGASGGTTSTSSYIVNLASTNYNEGCFLLIKSPPKVATAKPTNTNDHFFKYTVLWEVAFVVPRPEDLVRIWSITNADITL